MTFLNELNKDIVATHKSLADLNDAQTPFEKIADVIEEKL